jgi:hypothetical protein
MRVNGRRVIRQNPRRASACCRNGPLTAALCYPASITRASRVARPAALLHLLQLGRLRPWPRTPRRAPPAHRCARNARAPPRPASGSCWTRSAWTGMSPRRGRRRRAWLPVARPLTAIRPDRPASRMSRQQAPRHASSSAHHASSTNRPRRQGQPRPSSVYWLGTLVRSRAHSCGGPVTTGSHGPPRTLTV